MQSSRRAPARMRYGQILDTSGKSAALLHHRTIRQTHTWPRNGGDRRKCQTNTASPAEPGGLPVILDNIECRDAVLGPDLCESAWPQADVVIGNPPFLGDRRMISVLGQELSEALRNAWRGRVPRGRRSCLLLVRES